MNNEIKEILDKLSNRKQETLIQGLRECQLKDIEHPFITKEEYIDKILDYITNLQERCEYLERSNNRREDDILYKRQEISDLEDKIDKAIEYLNTRVDSSKAGKYELLNILQGSDKE